MYPAEYVEAWECMTVSYRSIGEGGLAELTALLEWAAPSSLRIPPGPGRIPPSVTKKKAKKSYW